MLFRSVAATAAARAAPAKQAQIAITLDLEMSRNFPTWETTHWDFEKGNLNAETIDYAVTVEDPTTWTKPWSGEVPWPRVNGPMYEAACTEENFSLVQLLKSTVFTREQEAKKKTGTNQQQ